MCRTGCATKDHESWGACARASLLQVDGSFERVESRSKWDKELAAYESARKQGIHPKGTRMHQVEAAKAFADKTGVGNPWR